MNTRRQKKSHGTHTKICTEATACTAVVQAVATPGNQDTQDHILLRSASGVKGIYCEEM